MPAFPPLFLSHGAPNMGLRDIPVRDFLRSLGERYQKPEAIISISAHFETTGVAVVSDPAPNMIYDFRGFEKELHEFRYPAPGEPELAAEVISCLRDEGLPVVEVEMRGYDHGTWVPLSLVYPTADIPIVQVSIDPEQTPEFHYRMGKVLSGFPARNIAVIGTGNITHNLSALFAKGRDLELDTNIKQYVVEFLEWLDSQLESGNTDNLLNYREKAPYAAENHPTDEHFLPIFAALGAAGSRVKGTKLHASYDFDFLAMDAWAFAPLQTA